ncbi:WxL domain-containing protein [Enterococcus mundtii]|nr:WxL domain-containing protein [Enterococcus mundtii]
MPVGLHDSRPAWQDEVKVTVEIERDGAVIQTYETLTHGHTAEKPGISIYDEEPQGGVFEIELDEYLQAGDLVRITDVEVLAGEMEGDFQNVYEVEDVTVFPIIPPSPATFSNHLVPANARVISGHSDDPEVEVTATHNGETIDPTLITIDDKGDIRIAVEKLNLAVDDVIQVFLRDHQGSASEAGVMNPPETNNHVGNINPKTPLAFRDATFVPATTLIVGGMVDGELTIDQASNWDFGTQPLTTKTQTYHALPSQVGGTAQGTSRPNFVQVTDERPVSEISGWSLFIKQEEQFSNQKQVN